MQTHLIVGFGEVGKAIQNIFAATVHDPHLNYKATGLFDVMHVCMPYFDGFIHSVQEYQKKFRPQLIIVHSTVPVGTCKLIPAVHSPIRGVHPNLEKGIMRMTKYFGGDNSEEAAEIFGKKGIHCVCVDSSDTTEAAKLWSTTQYGLFIALNKYMYAWCEEMGVDFNTVYTDFNETYNEGYKKLKKKHVRRPVLKYMDGKIGGHCVMSNLELLNDGFICDIIKEVNKGQKPNGS